MNDLEDRVRDLLDRRAAQATVSPDAWARIERRLEASGTPRPWWRPTAGRLALAAATAVVLAALVAVGSQQLLTGGTSVEIEPLAPDTAEAPDGAADPDLSSDVEATPDPPAPEMGPFERVGGPIDPPAAEAGLWVNDAVAADGLVLVVAGDGQLWRSEDGGESFARVDDDGFAARDGVAVDLRAVTVTADGFLVAGGTYGEGVVWRSEDGAAWDPVEVPEAGLLYDLVAADGRVVAVGRGPDGAAAFVSDDHGRSWEPAEIDGAEAGDENGMFVVAYGPAGWVATGYGAGDSSHATVWLASDGRSWELVRDTGIAGDGVIDAIAADETRYLAVRADGTVLSSTDGRSWEETAHLTGASAGEGAGEPGVVRFGGLARVEEGWLAVGGTPDLEAAPLAYLSADGSRWISGPIADRGDAQALAMLPDGTAIVVGRGDACWDRDDCPNRTHDLYVWRSTR